MANKKSNDLMKLDLYQLLNVPEDANAKQIKKAYRIKALKCHPDKNPDNPNAAELFHQLAEALKILSDVGARAAYDHLRKARKAAKERNDQLDARRKKVKLDLEARERAAEEIEKKQAKTTLKQEIERLREQGSRILEEEQRRMREQMQEEKKVAEASLLKRNDPARLKLKWKSSKNDPDNGGYSYDLLHKMFSKYGEITALMISKKKQGTAVVEFDDAAAAELAIEAELGSSSNPLKISWLSGKPERATTHSGGQTTLREQSREGASATYQSPVFGSRLDSTATSCGDDFEAMVLMRLKREQERKRMSAEEMKANDEVLNTDSTTSTET